MLRLKRFLKPFVIGLILAVGLLFVQAIAELSLPNYMSRIVNVGIQQGGIESPVPEQLSADGMKLVQLFMTEAERNLVDNQYELDDSDNTYLLKQTLKDADVTTKANLEQAFSVAALTFVELVMMEMEVTAPDQIEQVEESEKDTQGQVQIDFSLIYPYLPLLEALPQEEIDSTRASVVLQEPMMLTQAGIMLTKGFYQELDIDLGTIQTKYILLIGLRMLAVSLVGVLAAIGVGFLAARISASVARDLRSAVFTKVESFSSKEFNKFSTASLITRNTNDITQLQMLVMIGIRLVAYAPVLATGGIIMALSKSPSMSWIIGLATLILILLVIIIMLIALPKFKIIQKLIDKLNLVSRENLSGLMVVRAFGNQEHEIERFDKANVDLTKTNLFINRVIVFMMPAMMFIMNGVMVLIVWVGAQYIAASSIQVGDMMAFMQYAMQIIMSFLMMSMLFIILPRAAVSAERVNEVLDTEISITDPKEPLSWDDHRDMKSKGLVEFSNVDFRYPDAEENALCDITFTAQPGTTTAIIGSTGSGKSTIANLLLRFHDVTGGSIKINGIDLRDLTLTKLRDVIGYVPQKGILMSGTIASNVKYGRPDASYDEMTEVAEVAQATDFIDEKENQFAAEISQGGSNVSGGQKQRLAIMRALIKKPEILIFDDSFSALDYRTDAELRKALKEYAAGTTQIIIAQRVSTIMQAEQIIVLENGEVVGIGTHQELLVKSPTYYEIASSQLSKEELR